MIPLIVMLIMIIILTPTILPREDNNLMVQQHFWGIPDEQTMLATASAQQCTVGAAPLRTGHF